MMKTQAIFALYPNVVVIRDWVAFDADENIVEYDEDSVNAKAIEIQSEWDATAKAKVDAKQIALNKLMALGLTEEEALALGK